MSYFLIFSFKKSPKKLLIRKKRSLNLKIFSNKNENKYIYDNISHKKPNNYFHHWFLALLTVLEESTCINIYLQSKKTMYTKANTIMIKNICSEKEQIDYEKDIIQILTSSNA